MTRSYLVPVLAFVATTTAVLVACSGDDATSSSSSSSSSGGSSSGSTPTSVAIRASEGGTVSDPSGTATLTIPPGALQQDTVITLQVLPAVGGTVSAVYDFGPNGTTFTTLAKLDIKLDPSLVTAGSTPVVGIVDGSTFEPIPESTYAGGVASAAIAHFTSFALLLQPSKGTPGGKDAPVRTGDCKFKGTYTLEKYMCGTSDITAGWKTAIPTETLVVTDRSGGGCTMVITHASSTCSEVESLDVTPIAAPSHQLAWKGISSCNPAGCKFVASDAPCAVGDRVATETANVTAEGTKLRIVKKTTASDVCGGQDADTLFAP